MSPSGLSTLNVVQGSDPGDLTGLEAAGTQILERELPFLDTHVDHATLGGSMLEGFGGGRP